MTIEPPSATIGQRSSSGEKVTVASDCSAMYYTSQMPPETPDQYLPTDQPNILGTSPSSMYMYEQDVSDMQKALLSPVSTQSSISLAENISGQITSKPNTVAGGLESVEESRLNMEDMELTFDCQKRVPQTEGIKTEPPWSPGVPLDTGQAPVKFKYEDVLMNKRGSHGPTLAELNNTSVLDDPTVLDDINSIINNDLKGMPNLTTLKLEPTPAQIRGVNITIPKKPQQTNVPTCPPVAKFVTATVSSPNQTMPQPVIIKPEPQTPVMTVPVQIFQPATVSVPPVVMPKPKLPVDWSYPGELSTVDKPSLLKLLAPDASPKTGIKQNIARRPIHVPKRTRGLSEGSGLLHLEEEARGVKRSGSDESNVSNSSTNSFVQKWEEIKKYLEEGAPGSSKNMSTPPKKIKVEHSGDSFEAAGKEVAESQQQEYETDSDSDLEFSDTESVGSHSSFVEELLVGGKKDKRFFWQYNTQAKGPKGKRLCKNVENTDPHVLNSFEDPVFDPEMNDAKYRHTGRARKGDGNDVTPSPWKLFQIGNQLKRLNKKIHDIAPPSDLPATVRNDTRREKNKYASRACRLKKKAQHEANKIKLYGLDTEHAELMTVLVQMRDAILRGAGQGVAHGETYTAMLDRLVKQHLTVMIAGNTADYVNSVLEKVAQGDKTGGLDLRRR